MADVATVGSAPVSIAVTPDAPVGLPDAVTKAHLVRAAMATIRKDPDNADWGKVERYTHELYGALTVAGQQLTDGQRREISDVLVEARDVASAANNYSLLEIIGMILLGLATFGVVPAAIGITDALTTNGHEATVEEIDGMIVPANDAQTGWLRDAIAPGTRGADTKEVKEAVADKGETLAMRAPEAISALSMAQRAAVARKVSNEAKEPQQIVFIRNLLASNPAALSDNIRMLNTFDAEVLAKAVRSQDIATADAASKFFLSAIISRRGDHDDMTTYAMANKDTLDAKSRASLIRGLLAGWTKQAAENAVVALLFPVPGEFKVAEETLIGGNMGQTGLARIRDEVESGPDSPLGIAMRKLFEKTGDANLQQWLDGAGYSLQGR